MAYMDQEKKAKISAGLKKIMPRDWKYSLAVKHHSSIVLTINAAPVDLIALNLRSDENKGKYIQVNEYYLDREYAGDVLAVFEAMKRTLNLDNYDHSDSQFDHFDVGHYIDIHVGRWDKPFVCTAALSIAA